MSKKQGTDAAPAAPEAKTTAPAPKAAKRDAASSSGAGETKGGLGARIREFRDYLVLGFVAVMAVLLGVVDLILSGLVRFILS